jgi:hypothetical protein
MYAGCVTSAIQKQTYIELIADNGFVHTAVQQEKEIHLPDDILATYLSKKEIAQFRNRPAILQSITVYAEKPL